MLYESDPLSVAWHSGPKCQGQCQKKSKKRTEQNRKIKGAWCDILVRRMPYFISIAKSVMLQRFMGAVTMLSLSLLLSTSLFHSLTPKNLVMFCVCVTDTAHNKVAHKYGKIL